MQESSIECDLLVRMARGDESSLAELYDRLAGLAWGLARRITGNARDAEDVVQEAFLRAWHRAASYRPELGSPRGWILRIVRNAAIDHLRGETRRQRLAGAVGSDPVTPSEAPDARASADERCRRLVSALRELPEEQRRLIELSYFDGLSHAEIARREGIPLGTVKGRIREGVLHLRRVAEEGRIHA